MTTDPDAQMAKGVASRDACIGVATTFTVLAGEQNC